MFVVKHANLFSIIVRSFVRLCIIIQNTPEYSVCILLTVLMNIFLTHFDFSFSSLIFTLLACVHFYFSSLVSTLLACVPSCFDLLRNGTRKKFLYAMVRWFIFYPRYPQYVFFSNYVTSNYIFCISYHLQNFSNYLTFKGQVILKR